LGKPVVIYANGFTKFEHAITKIGLWNILARYVLSNADLITVREEESYRNLKDISVNNTRIYLTADPAFLLSPVSYNKVKSILLAENINKSNSLLIGMTQTREILLSVRQGNPREIYKKGVEQMARLVDHLIAKLDATIVFLPHCIEPYRQGNGDDRTVAKEVYDLITNKHKVVIITKEYSAEELKGLIGIFDLFIGGRVHSVINALSMGVPSITLTRSNDERVRGIIGKTLKQEEWICNIEGLNSEILLSKIMALLPLREEIRKNLAVRMCITKEKALLNGKLLKALLDSR